MNSKKAKALRRLAAQEFNLRADETLAYVHRVNGREVTQLINEPHSHRAMTNALKKQYKIAAARGDFAKPGTEAERKAAEQA